MCGTCTTLRRAHKDQLHAFANLTVKPVGIEDGCLLLRGESSGGRLILRLGLHFAEERLVFDPDGDVAVVGDGGVDAVHCAIDQLRLLSSLLSNAQLEVRDATTGALLGRTDPYIPVNIDLGATPRNIEHRIEDLTKVTDDREKTDTAPIASAAARNPAAGGHPGECDRLI